MAMATILIAASANAEEWRASVEQYWVDKGLTLAAAEGIADQVAKESGGNPTIIGDGGSSLGMFQHHAQRMERLLARIENDQAFAELMGEDPIAATHFDELKNARSRKESSQIWQKYFERPAIVKSTDKKPAPKVHPPIIETPPPNVLTAATVMNSDPFLTSSRDQTFLITNQQ
jgi:hypothetical protein